MVSTKVAHTYARALFAVAEEAHLLDTMERELHLVRGLVADHPELGSEFRDFLEHPRLSPVKKKDVVQRVLAESVSPLTIDFLSLMIDKKRAGQILATIQEFDKLLDVARGIQRAEVRSAVPLSDELAQRLTEKLAAMTGMEIILERVVEEALIGGLVIHVGGRLIDGSIQSHLESIREQLQRVRVVEPVSREER